ncbi:MAG TPA: hypothetical protein VMF58_07760 [Rhizomicrobium sp.]|nr:hypothetical protein [Rhizomicrobium sp.]
MLSRISLASVFVLAMAAPAIAADACGDAPYAPAIDKPAAIASKSVDAARAELMDQYKEVKAYQGQLKDFRACLEGQDRQDKIALRAAQQKKDKDSEVARIQGQIDDRKKTYDATVDSETQVATDFNTLHTAHCARDTDTTVCPQKKQ